MASESSRCFSLLAANFYRFVVVSNASITPLSSLTTFKARVGSNKRFWQFDEMLNVLQLRGKGGGLFSDLNVNNAFTSECLTYKEVKTHIEKLLYNIYVYFVQFKQWSLLLVW